MTREPRMQDSGERRTFPSGAVRDRGEFKPRPDLISPHAQLREGAWVAKGAEKYKPRNWESGIPISECVASMCRHIEAYKLGLRDEDHMAAIRTNAGFILHYEEEIKAGRLPTSLDDMPHYEDRGMVPRFLAVDAHLEKIQKKLDETFGVSAEDMGGPVTQETKPFTVYLCGPITGQRVDSLWRNAATAYLSVRGIRTLDPMRGKDSTRIGNLGMDYEGQPATTEMADRDHLDVEQADIIFAHFPYAPPRQSIGSLMEMGGAAIGMRKLIILCTEVPEFNQHLFTRRFCVIEPDFAKALNKIVEIATHANSR